MDVAEDEFPTRFMKSFFHFGLDKGGDIGLVVPEPFSDGHFTEGLEDSKAKICTHFLLDASSQLVVMYFHVDFGRSGAPP